MLQTRTDRSFAGTEKSRRRRDAVHRLTGAAEESADRKQTRPLQRHVLCHDQMAKRGYTHRQKFSRVHD